MAELRYNRAFKKGLAVLLLCVLLFGAVTAFSIIAQVQYRALVSGMKPAEATVVDVHLDVHVKGPDEQEIYISYEVDGVTYSRELKTDTQISFAAGSGAHYSVGDKIKIFYDPQNPEVIASPRSVVVGYFYMAIGLLGLALVMFSLCCVLKRRREALMTPKEYEQEGLEIKKRRRDKKEQKKQRRLERKKKYAKERRAFRIILMILSVPLGCLVLLLLLGLLLKAVGY